MIKQNERKKRFYKKQAPTSFSHIPVILIKFEIISLVFETERHKEMYKFLPVLYYFVKSLRERADKMENKIFCLGVSDKIKMYKFLFTFISLIILRILSFTGPICNGLLMILHYYCDI
jgi:hypothetical protein